MKKATVRRKSLRSKVSSLLKQTSSHNPSNCQSSATECLLPSSDKRFLAKFELLHTREQVAYCNRIWASEETLNCGVYKAWEELKCSSIGRVNQAGKEPLTVEKPQSGEKPQSWVLKSLQISIEQEQEKKGGKGHGSIMERTFIG